MTLNLIALLSKFDQPEWSGGSHTAPELRLLLFALAYSLRATRIIETGYDAGMTTVVLAETGAEVVGIDNGEEYPNVKGAATERVKEYPNIELIEGDALEYLRSQADNSIDFIFIDDAHHYNWVLTEALEVKRILRPGGLAAFHDTTECNIWEIIDNVFADWQRIELPAISPGLSRDMGVGVVRKPGNGV